jgi:phosphoribosyl 1,2-cyclic phosphodiesterase
MMPFDRRRRIYAGTAALEDRVLQRILQHGTERAILKVCILASSSAGNCTFISSGKTRILIDAGLSCKEIREKLGLIGEAFEALDAVLVSHEHSDHSCGLSPLARKYRSVRKADLPVYATHLSARALDWGTFEFPKIEPFQAGERFTIGDLEIESFTVPHDSIDPVGFCVCADGVKLSLVTDLGYMPESVRFHVRRSDFLILESNHDLDMLRVGPYPWPVKQRVMGRSGHLSNSMVADFILDGLDLSVRNLVLAHLSEHNNHPVIAERSATEALRRRGSQAMLFVIPPGAQSHVWEL